MSETIELLICDLLMIIFMVCQYDRRDSRGIKILIAVTVCILAAAAIRQIVNLVGG